jgi:pimeloyl-ACP methyl ester carboxylesterase
MNENSTTHRGFRALADAQRTMPEPQVARLVEGDIQYITAGEGSPAVVLLSSFGVPIPTWALVWHDLAVTATVFAYNRHGVGASAAPRQAQTGIAVVDTLRKTLASAGIEPPYVLVGHGLGGLFAQLYTRRFPHEVAGMVLVESAHPDDDALERRLRFLPPRLAAAMTAGALRGTARVHSEHRYHAQTAAAIRTAGPFPDIRLAVVTGERVPSKLTTAQPQAERHDRRQLDLVALSPQGTRLLAPHSGHFPQITDPDVVVRATRQVLAR